MKANVFRADFLRYEFDSISPISTRSCLSPGEGFDVVSRALRMGLSVVLSPEDGDAEATEAAPKAANGPDVDLYIVSGDIGKIGLGYPESHVLSFSGVHWPQATTLAVLALKEGYEAILWTADHRGDGGDGAT